MTQPDFSQLIYQGTQRHAPQGAFLTSCTHTGVLRNRGDALRISGNLYFSNLFRMSPSRTPSAFAILAQDTRRGSRLWFSIKLIAERLRPVFADSLSWDIVCSFLMRESSSITLLAKLSEDLSLIGTNHRGLAEYFVGHYSERMRFI